MTTEQEFLSIPSRFYCIATLLKNDYVRRFKDLELYCSQVLKVAQRRRRGRKLVVVGERTKTVYYIPTTRASEQQILVTCDQMMRIFC